MNNQINRQTDPEAVEQRWYQRNKVKAGIDAAFYWPVYGFRCACIPVIVSVSLNRIPSIDI